MTTKLVKRTALQVQTAAELLDCTTTPTTIELVGSPAEAMAHVDEVLGKVTDKGQRQCLHSIRRALVKLNPDGESKPPAETSLKVVEVVAAKPTDAAAKAVAKALNAALVIDASTVEGAAARKEAAVAESKALKAWQSKGEKGERPATPNLDQMDAEYNGSKPKTKIRSKRGTSQRVEHVEPKSQRGYTNIKLRSPKAAEVVSGFVTVPTFSGPWMTVKNADAQRFFDEMVEASKSATQFERRMLTIASVRLRHAFPKIRDDRNSKATSVLNALIATGKSWTPFVKNDNTVGIEVDGERFETWRDVAVHLGLNDKAA